MCLAAVHNAINISLRPKLPPTPFLIAPRMYTVLRLAHLDTVMVPHDFVVFIPPFQCATFQLLRRCFLIGKPVPFLVQSWLACNLPLSSRKRFVAVQRDRLDLQVVEVLKRFVEVTANFAVVHLLSLPACETVSDVDRQAFLAYLPKSEYTNSSGSIKSIIDFVLPLRYAATYFSCRATM